VWSGVPARKLRDVTPEEAAFITRSAESYASLGLKHFEENQKVWLVRSPASCIVLSGVSHRKIVSCRYI
jgi:hypothetical protein